MTTPGPHAPITDYSHDGYAYPRQLDDDDARRYVVKTEAWAHDDARDIARAIEYGYPVPRRLRTYAGFDAWLGRRARRRLANNTYAVRRGSTIAVMLHDTAIVTYQPDGTVTLDSGGWYTDTTFRRINEYTPHGVTVNRWTMPRAHAARGALTPSDAGYSDAAYVDEQGQAVAYPPLPLRARGWTPGIQSWYERAYDRATRTYWTVTRYDGTVVPFTDGLTVKLPRQWAHV